MPTVKKVEKDLVEMFDKTLTWHTFRIDKTIDAKEMKEFVLEEFDSKKWLVGHEKKSSGQEHSHIILSTANAALSDYKMNKIIRDRFDVSKSQFSKSQVRTTVHRAVCYTVKDGDYESSGFDTEYLKKAKVQSTKKFKKDEYKEALIELETQYYQNHINFHTFCDEFINLKIVVYGQRINRKSEITWLVTHRIRKDPSEMSKYKKDTAQACDNYFLDY